MDDVPSWIIIGGVGVGLFLAIIAVVVSLWRSRGPQSAAIEPDAPGWPRSVERPIVAKMRAAKADAKAKAAVADSIPDPAVITGPRKWRMAGMAIASFILLAVIWWIARQQLGVLLFKGAMLTNAAFVGYWADRTLFPDTRPHIFAADPALRWRYEMRRVVLVATCMLGACLGA